MNETARRRWAIRAWRHLNKHPLDSLAKKRLYTAWIFAVYMLVGGFQS